jgi:hypothetical protein
MCGGSVHTFNISDVAALGLGREGGVVALYDASGNSAVLSSAANFMVSGLAATSWIPNALGGGLGGLVDPIPAGFTHQTIMVGGSGVNDTMYAWGSLLLQLGGKTRPAPDVDIVVSRLGYWTDNGAATYYNPEPNKTFEATMLDMKSYWQDKLGLPVAYFQYDSWW